MQPFATSSSSSSTSSSSSPTRAPEVLEFQEHQVQPAGRYLVCRRCGAHALIEAPASRSLLQPCQGKPSAGQLWFRDEVLAGREPRLPWERE